VTAGLQRNDSSDAEVPCSTPWIDQAERWIPAANHSATKQPAWANRLIRLLVDGGADGHQGGEGVLVELGTRPVGL
jgi:hypothetical protein